MSEKQIDALFRRIVQNDAEEESRKLVEQRQEKPGDAVPELSRLRFEKMLDRELSDGTAKKEKTRRRFVLSRTAKRIIVAAAACVVVMFGLMMTSEAVRGRITQFFITLTRGHAQVELDNTEELPPSEKVIYQLTYVPEGYRLVSEEHAIGQQLRYRKSEEELFDFDVYTRDDVTQLDTEFARKVEYVDIHGETGLLIVYDDYATVSWSNEQYLFCIGGTLSEKEALKIANGVTVTENYPEVDPENFEETDGIEVDGFDDPPVIWENCYDLGYLPEGFEQTYCRKNPTQLFQYQREHEFLDFLVLLNEEAEKPDTKNADRVEQITVNGYAGLLIVRRDRITVTWANETDTFLLEGNISEEEMLKVANGVYIGTVIVRP